MSPNGGASVQFPRFVPISASNSERSSSCSQAAGRTNPFTSPGANDFDLGELDNLANFLLGENLLGHGTSGLGLFDDDEISSAVMGGDGRADLLPLHYQAAHQQQYQFRPLAPPPPATAAAVASTNPYDQYQHPHQQHIQQQQPLQPPTASSSHFASTALPVDLGMEQVFNSSSYVASYATNATSGNYVLPGASTGVVKAPPAASNSPQQVPTRPVKSAAAPTADNAAGSSAEVKPRRQRSSNKEEQQRKRRERNRALAKRTRQRKKFYYIGLQTQVAQLQLDNERLKEIVRTRGTEKAKAILKLCKTELPSIVTENSMQATCLLEQSDFRLIKSLQASQPSFCITDVRQADNPIVFVSDAFVEMTGYKRSQVLGRNCRFLQGPATDNQVVLKMREKIQMGEEVRVVLRNYKADGTPFLNQVYCVPLHGPDGSVINYVGVQNAVEADFDDAALERLNASEAM